MSDHALLVAARRTPVAPRGGALAAVEIHDLAAPCLRAALADVGAGPDAVDDVLLGNALGAGGNPARLVGLAAGLPDRVPALTVDGQCCAGLDAVALAAARIRAGEADLVVAGGAESWSRAPLRSRRPKAPGEAPVAYDRPPFTPFPDRDPDMIEAAAELARLRHVDRIRQEDHAVASHAAARLAGPPPSLVPVAGLDRDAFTRRLTPALCARLPIVAGDATHGLTAATIAVEADAAALLLVASAEGARRLGCRRGLRILATARVGGDPAQPALVPVAAARLALARAGIAVADLAAIEIMEAFAVQALVFLDELAVPPGVADRAGGALARGHPIGASGAILLCGLFDRLAPGELGLAAIAAAGGLGSAMVVEAVVPPFGRGPWRADDVSTRPKRPA